MYHQRWSLLFATFLVLLFSYFPSFIERKYDIFLPIEYEFLMVLFIYVSLFLGSVHSYYTRIWWWDILLHVSSGLVLGFCGFLLLYVLYYKNKITSKPFWLVFFSFCFALALGTLWEIFEFSMDQSFGLNMQKSGLIDTMWDLIVDALGAFVTSLLGYFYIQGKKTPLFHRLLQKFEKRNPRFFH